MTDPAALPPCPFKARVLHSYEPYEAKEIPLLANTIVNVLRVHSTGWWRGEYNGKSGWFPSSHVQVISDSVPEQRAPEPAADPHPKRSKMSRIQDMLARFFGGQRAKRRELEQRGVLASDSTRVFGRCIWDIVERDKGAGVSHNIPLFLDRCFEVLWTSGFEVEGLFRVPAGQAQLTSFKEQLDKDPLGVQFNAEQDAGICGGLLKLFIREHPEPIITKALYPHYLEVGDEEQSEESRVSRAARLITEEPLVTRAFLAQLISFLYECVTNHHQKMRMLPKAYATIFGPVIITDSVETCGCNLADITGQINCFEFFITSWDKIRSQAGVDRYGALSAGTHVVSPAPAQSHAASRPSGSSATPYSGVATSTTSEPTESTPSDSFGKADIVCACFDYDPGSEAKKISLSTGDYLVIERPPEKGWCKGMRIVDGVASSDQGQRGWFPASYVRLVSSSESASILKMT